MTMTDADFRRLMRAFPETTEGRHGHGVAPIRTGQPGQVFHRMKPAIPSGNGAEPSAPDHGERPAPGLPPGPLTLKLVILTAASGSQINRWPPMHPDTQLPASLARETFADLCGMLPKLAPDTLGARASREAAAMAAVAALHPAATERAGYWFRDASVPAPAPSPTRPRHPHPRRRQPAAKPRLRPARPGNHRRPHRHGLRPQPASRNPMIADTETEPPTQPCHDGRPVPACPRMT